MKHPGDTNSAAAYIINKMNRAGANADRLMDLINRLARLAYEKGTRKGDISIREKLARVVEFLQEYFRTARLFASGKGGDAGAFREILAFFDERFLERNALEGPVDALKQEIAAQERLDREHNARHAGDGYVRKVNLYAKEFGSTLKEWEKLLLYHAEPQLRRFLTDINDIVLYHGIDAAIPRLITGGDVFARSGPHYQEFKNTIARHAQINVKLIRAAQTEADIKESISQTLQQMGFRDVILRSRNINREIFDEMLTEAVNEGDLVNCMKRYARSSQDALQQMRKFEKKQEQDKIRMEDLNRLLEDLCYLDDPDEIVQPGIPGRLSDLVKSDSGRYLFHSPGTFEISLKFVSEYMRDSLIFVLDWLNKELKKTPALSRPLSPLIECFTAVGRFIDAYKLALDVSANRSNRSGTASKEKHYISAALADELIGSIRDNCMKVRNALVDVAYAISSGAYDRTGALTKKINILRESCNASHLKITGGLEKIEGTRRT